MRRSGQALSDGCAVTRRVETKHTGVVEVFPKETSGGAQAIAEIRERSLTAYDTRENDLISGLWHGCCVAPVTTVHSHRRETSIHVTQLR